MCLFHGFFLFFSLYSAFRSSKWRSHLQVTPLPPVLLKQFLKMYLHTGDTHNPCRLDFHERLLSEPPAAAPTPHPLPPPGSRAPKAGWDQLPGCHSTTAAGLGEILDKLPHFHQALLPMNKRTPLRCLQGIGSPEVSDTGFLVSSSS